jgi:hypothetical protein
VRETVVRCDRCAAAITERASVGRVEAGSIRDRLPDPLDLCEPCSQMLLEWLATGRGPRPCQVGACAPKCRNRSS